MFRIDVGQQLTFSYQKRYQRVQSNQILTLFPRIVLRLCVATFCTGVCLLRNVVDSVQFALSLVCTFIAYIRRSFKLLTGTILKGSAYLLAVHFPAGCNKYESNPLFRTALSACIPQRAAGLSREFVFHFFGSLSIHGGGFCGSILQSPSGSFWRRVLPLWQFCPIMSFDS